MRLPHSGPDSETGRTFGIFSMPDGCHGVDFNLGPPAGART